MKARVLDISEDEKRAVLEHYNCTEEELEELINRISEWIIKTNLPVEENPRNKYRTALFNCKMSLERAKQALKSYYQIRTVYSNFFDMLVPNTNNYHLCKRLAKMAIFQKLTPNLCRICCCRFDDPQALAPDGLVYLLIPIMNAELQIASENYFVSHIILLDMEGFGLKNLIKFTPTVINMLIDLMVAINLRLKGIHFLNAPSIMDKIMFLVRNYLPAKFQKKVYVHKNADTLYQYIPKECLPENYGGALRSLEELHEDWCGAAESQVEFFKTLLTVKCKKEDLIDMQTQKRNNDSDFGTDGSFRKLNID